MDTHHSPPQGISIGVKIRLSIRSNHILLCQVDKVAGMKERIYDGNVFFNCNSICPALTFAKYNKWIKCHVFNLFEPQSNRSGIGIFPMFAPVEYFLLPTWRIWAPGSQYKGWWSAPAKKNGESAFCQNGLNFHSKFRSFCTTVRRIMYLSIKDNLFKTNQEKLWMEQHCLSEDENTT